VKNKCVRTGLYQNLRQDFFPLDELDRSILRTVFRRQIILGIIVFMVIGGLAAAGYFFFGNIQFKKVGWSFEVVISAVFNLVLAFLVGLMTWGILRARGRLNDPWKIVYSGEVSDLWQSGRVGDRAPGSGSYNLRLDGVRFQIDADSYAMLKIGDSVLVHCIAPGEVIYISRLTTPNESVIEEIPPKNSKDKIGVVAILLGILEIFHHC
jgi:hypothetical protein